MRLSRTYKVLFKSIFTVLLAVFMFLTARDSQAQFYNGSQLTFGKSRVQYNEFLWTFFQFDNFDTYFYLNGRDLAVYAARYADAHLDEIESSLETTLDQKIQFIIFNSLSDLKQSNIGLISDQQYNTGGITHIIGHKVFIYFDGDLNDFQKQIRAGIAKILIEQMLYGGSVGTQIKNTTLMALPEWYVDGIISYISEEWNSKIDNYVKDGILSGRYEKFNQLTGEEAVHAGHAIWNFVAEKYGKAVISNILYMSKISRNVESGFLYVIGISYNNLMTECYNYYLQKYSNADEIRDMPQGKLLLKKSKKEVYYSNIKISPDGRYTAFTSNQLGKYKLYLIDNVTGKTRKIIGGGYKLQEKIDHSYPIMAWHPTGRLLAFIVEAKGQVFLYYYDIETRKKIRQTIFNFEKILDFSYSDDGTAFLFSAVQKGQSDIFIYKIASNSFDRLTNDIYNDLYPRFINNSSKIIFSSNRKSDTLNTGELVGLDDLQEYNDLFLYDYKTNRKVLRRITSTPFADEIYAMEYEEGYIAYLSDYNGIYNRYIASFDSSITFIDTATHYRYFVNAFPVTNYARSIIFHDISSSSGTYGEVIFKDQRFWMYTDELMPVNEIFAQELKNTVYAEVLKKKFEAEGIIDSGGKTKTKRRKKRFSNVYTLDEESIIEQNKIDIDNYQFDRQSFITVNESDAVSEGEDRFEYEPEPVLRIPKQRNYNVQYSMNELVSQIDFTYLNFAYQTFAGGGSPIYQTPGFNAFFKVGIMDLMEDYRITAGVRLSVDLAHNEYVLRFSNLRKRLDKEILVHRKVWEEYGVYSLMKHIEHEVHYALKYPFSPVMSVRGTIMLRNDRAVFLSTDQVNLKEPDRNINWAVLKAEFIFDNTRDLGLNLYEGTRMKFFGEYYNQISTNLKEYVAIVGFDVRHYIKIHRTLILANRIAGSSSFGPQKLIYYMGGVDNWVSPRFNRDTPIDYSQNYIFQTLATNLRGFDQNIRNGNNFLVINSELRLPLFRYLANKPLKSDFLNNFQVVGFGDIGTAWSGLNPYSPENSLFTRVISKPPLLITVEMQKDPIVGGFGFGLRSRIFGYFIRADMSWGVEDGVVLPSKFYFSLSLDF